jgi:hypothetical protein
MTAKSVVWVAAVTAWVTLAQPAAAQKAPVTQRGFLEGTGILYPQATPTDDTRAVGDALLRQDASWRATPWLTFGGSFEVRTSSDSRVARSWSIDWEDRGARRPTLSVRGLSAAVRAGGLTLEAGKLFVRWGKADILNPTDRFAPRDFLEVVDNYFLGVTGARATYERGTETIDLVWVPVFTPSRLPLAGSRWAATSSDNVQADVPGALPSPFPLVDLGAIFPSRPQAGIRWNHVGSGFEHSLSYFDGFNFFPRFDVAVKPALGRAELLRRYSPLKMAGADAAWPLRWFTLKGEVGWFRTTDPAADDYGIYVIQVERQHGEWLFVGGYAGQFVTRRRAAASSADFAFDRGLADTFLGRASYTIDPRSSLAFEGAIRNDASGGWIKGEYSRTVGQHWRATARGDLLTGAADDFFGRYRRNSSLRFALRYSY